MLPHIDRFNAKHNLSLTINKHSAPFFRAHDSSATRHRSLPISILPHVYLWLKMAILGRLPSSNQISFH
jgi:hypothetical protein